MPGRYRGHDSRDNLFYTASGEVVYSSAGVGIVYNRKTHTQRFFLDHTDDIICVALHPDGTVAATGEIGKCCLVCVWDIENLKCHAKLEGFHTRGVCSLAFSKDGDKLFSVGLDDDHQRAVGVLRLLERLAAADVKKVQRAVHLLQARQHRGRR